MQIPAGRGRPLQIVFRMLFARWQLAANNPAPFLGTELIAFYSGEKTILECRDFKRFPRKSFGALVNPGCAFSF